MAKRRSRHNTGTGNAQENALIRAVDEKAMLTKIREEVAPKLQKDLANGLSAEEIFRKYDKLVAARLVSIALYEPDNGKALSAIKDLMDRSIGKPGEKKEITHRLGTLSDNELDALLLSKAGVVGEEGEGTGE